MERNTNEQQAQAPIIIEEPIPPTDEVGLLEQLQAQQSDETMNAERRDAQIARLQRVVDPVAKAVEDTTRKAIMKAKPDKNASSFKEKLVSAMKDVGVTTLRGLAAYAIPKIAATAISAIPALAGLCVETVEDPVASALLAKTLRFSLEPTDIQLQTRGDRWAGARNVMQTMPQYDFISRNTMGTNSLLSYFALGVQDRSLYADTNGGYGAATHNLPWTRFEAEPVNTSRYAFVDWAKRYTELYNGVDPGPVLRDARQSVDFYNLSNTVGAVKAMLGEPEKLQFSATEALLKLFLYILQYYQLPVGQEVPVPIGTFTQFNSFQAASFNFPATNSGPAIAVNAWATTLSRFTTYNIGNAPVPAPVFRANASYSSSVAVVPITTAMYQSTDTLALWTAMFIEYPYSYRQTLINYTDRVGNVLKNNSNANTAGVWKPRAAPVFISGPRQVLYVLVDANIDQVTPVPIGGGVPFDQVAAVDIAPSLTAIISEGGASSDAFFQAANYCIKLWVSGFGSIEDFRDAYMAAATVSVSSFLSTGAIGSNVLRGYALEPRVPNNASLVGPIAPPTGYNGYIALPGGEPKYGRMSILPHGDTCGSWSAISEVAAPKPTSLCYPQMSQSLAPYVFSRLWTPRVTASGEMNADPVQIFTGLVHTGMSMYGLFDYLRGIKGFSLETILTNRDQQSFQLFQMYHEMCAHIFKDLFGTGLTLRLSGCVESRAGDEYLNWYDANRSWNTTARTLPTSVLSCLAGTNISSSDITPIPVEGKRWERGNDRGFQFEGRVVRKKLFFENLFEYNIFGAVTNGNALFLTPNTVRVDSQITNADYLVWIRWMPADYQYLTNRVRLNNSLNLAYMVVTDDTSTVAPIAGLPLMTSVTRTGRPQFVTPIFLDPWISPGNVVRMRDKLMTNAGPGIKNVPWADEVGVALTISDLL